MIRSDLRAGQKVQFAKRRVGASLPKSKRENSETSMQKSPRHASHTRYIKHSTLCTTMMSLLLQDLVKVQTANQIGKTLCHDHAVENLCICKFMNK